MKMNPAYCELLGRVRRASRHWRWRRMAALTLACGGAAAALFWILAAVELLFHPRPAVCQTLSALAVLGISGVWGTGMALAIKRITSRRTARAIEDAAPANGRRLECALDLGASHAETPLALAALQQTADAYREVDFSAGLKLGKIKKTFLPAVLLLLSVSIGLCDAGIRATCGHWLVPGKFPRPRPAEDFISSWEPLPPTVTMVAFRVLPPAYIRQKEYVSADLSSRPLLTGSAVSLTLTASEGDALREAVGMLSPDAAPKQAQSLSLKRHTVNTFSGGFTARENARLAFFLRDNAGRNHAAATTWPVTVVADRLPEVTLELANTAANDKKRVFNAAPGEQLHFRVQAGDDYGLRDVRLVFQRNQHGEPQTVKSWPSAADCRKTPPLNYVFSLKADAFRNGDTVTFYAEAADGAPYDAQKTPAGRRTRSMPLQVNIVNRAAVTASEKQTLDAVLLKVGIAHRCQTEALRLTGALRLADARPVPAELLKLQNDTRGAVREAALLAEASRLPSAMRVREVLKGLADNELNTAVSGLQELRQASAGRERTLALRKVMPAQAEAHRRLGQILGIIEAVSAKPDPAEADTKDEDLPPPVVEKLNKLQKALDGLKETQKKIVSLEPTWTKKEVDDFTEEEKKQLEDLKAAEENWAKLLRDLHTDLSKVRPQDFSHPTLCGEVVTVLEEVEMVASSLTAKEVEIATTAAETGLELAESLTMSVEKWLMDKADHVAWKMEEPLKDYDVPMAELPEQLTDIVGELVEQEEELMAEAEDQSSSWGDSLDKGAGWDAADGPMSNFSAQGVTGNQLPNDTEVGGRSGQGRSGKSHGELVSDTAVDKGGRKTPARLTPDAFEKGEIKDLSTEASGGATGGGKGGGAGAEGLEGPAAPNRNQAMPRLRGKQAELRNKAERVNARLKLRGYNTEMLENTLNEIKAAESRGDNLYAVSGRAQRRLADSLRSTVDALATQARARRERGAGLPKDLQREIINTRADDFPAGYDEWLKAYYQRLAP